MTKYFEVWAETAMRAFSDGTIDIDADCANDNIRKYIVEEYGDGEGVGMITGVKEYKPEEFYKIAEDYPAPEWQNNMW